jgi:cold shock protein
MTGKIKKLTDRGFGFITKEDGEDIFFHSNDLEGVTFDELQEEMTVTFEIGESDRGKGPKAINVQPA